MSDAQVPSDPLLWRPIETAPRDGTVIDVWIAGEFEGRCADVVFDEHPHRCMSQYCDSCPDEEERGKKWRETVFNAPLIGEPTHWMPLPEPPK